jgi:flagellar hook-associated protein 1 FlgK
MSSLLASLQTSANALDVFEQEIGVVQDNVINASTPGYARQELDTSAVGYQPSAGLYGGVQAGQIESARSEFAETAVRNELTQDGYQTERSDTLQNIQSAFDVTGQSGLSLAMNDLFSAFSSWSESPDDVTQQQAVITAAGEFVTDAQQTASDLSQNAASVEQGIGAQISSINSLAQQVASINQSDQSNPNAASSNDAALNSDCEQLSQLVNFTTLTASDGTTTVLLDGQVPLVIGSQAYPISVSMVASGANNSPAEPHILDSSGNDITAHVTGGNLGGLLSVANGDLAALVGDSTQNGSLNNLVTGLATAVNNLLTSGQIDQSGTPGVALFNVTNDATAAATIALNPACDASQLAAIEPGPPTVSNGIANQLAALANDNSTMPGNQSFIGYYGNMASTVGASASAAQTAQASSDQLVAQARSLRTQISGVSLNDEAASLTQLQQAYDASSRVFTVVNQLMEDLYNAVSEVT